MIIQFGIIPWLTHLTTYWLLSFIFGCIDCYIIKKNKLSHKLQPNYLPVNIKKYKQLFLKLSKNILQFQFIYLLPLSIIFSYFAPNMYHLESESCNNLLWKFGIIILIEEFLFYHMHYLFHSKWLYKYHKLHHTINSPIAVSTIYCHPLENMFINIGPLLVGPYIVGLSWFWTQVWLVFATTNSIFVHSGYNFAKSHDNHHKYFKINYGVIGLFDWLYKTNNSLSSHH